MIIIKTPEEIEAMKKAGALSKMVLRRVGAMITPGVTTLELDRVCESIIRMHGGVPAFKGYRGFPASLCASINDQVVHGIPSETCVLSDGDIVSIDTGAIVDGWVGDNAWTFWCGTPTQERKALCEVTRDCLRASIDAAVPGARLGDVGHACQALAEKHGYGVVREYVGHGIGRAMHENPSVPNYGKPGRGVKLQVGMVIAIEPMICERGYATETLANRWTVVTADGGCAAHYENTIAITKDGPCILTVDDEGPWCEMQGGMVHE